MRDYRDAKAMARSLRQALHARGVAVSHSDSLELIARSFGLDNWNVLAARMAAGPRPAAEEAASGLDAVPLTKAALSRLNEAQLAVVFDVWRDVMMDRRKALGGRAKPANQP